MRRTLASLLASGLVSAAVEHHAGSSANRTPRRVQVAVHLNLTDVFTEVAPEFLSFSVDAADWRDYNVAPDPVLDLLSHALRPVQIRIGGSQADYDVYTVGNSTQTCHNLPWPMTGKKCREVFQAQWQALLDYCQRNGLGLVFGLNAMFGRPTAHEGLCNGNGCPPMDQSNLESLLRWTAEHYPHGPLVGLELGNELSRVLNGEDGAIALARDVQKLAQLRDELWANGTRPRIAGPNAGSEATFDKHGRKWISTFVEHAKGALDAVTFHEYALGSAHMRPDPLALNRSLFNHSVLDLSGHGADLVMQDIGGNLPFWVGATAAADRGVPNVTNTYADGFWYLDQLGSHALRGVQVVQREVLVGRSSNKMVDVREDGSFQPLPDFWVALLHKLLMGTKVLRAYSDYPDLRAYLHCAAGVAGGVSFAWLNLGTTDIEASSPDALGLFFEKWILTPGKVDGAASPFLSKEILLNGRRLELVGNMTHPQMPDLSGDTGIRRKVILPASSFGFLRFPLAKAPVCVVSHKKSVKKSATEEVVFV